MRIKLPIEVSNMSADDPRFVTSVAQTFNALALMLNGQISFIDNCKTSSVVVVFAAANKQQSVPHTLNKVPLGYIMIGSKAAAQIFDGTSGNTPQTLFVQSTVATTVRLLVF